MKKHGSTDRGGIPVKTNLVFLVLFIVCDRLLWTVVLGMKSIMAENLRRENFFLYLPLCLYFMPISQIPRDELSFSKSFASIPELELNAGKEVEW